jgi:FAD:protein FMN transferase
MKKIMVVMVLTLSSFFLFACQKSVQFSYSSFDYMDTYVALNGIAESDQQAEEVIAEVERIYALYHELSTGYEPLSEGSEYLENIYTINQKVGQTLEIDQALFDMIVFAEDIKTLTNGYFDISIGKIVDRWKSIILDQDPIEIGSKVWILPKKMYGTIESSTMNGTREVIKVVGDETEYHISELAREMDETRFNQVISQVALINTDDFLITLTEEAGKYYVRIDGVHIKLDLGAIAKGYATQKVYEYLKSVPIIDFSLSAGSSSIALGQNPNREGGIYIVALTNPLKTMNTAQTYGKVYVKDTTVTTSANYEQFFMYEGLRYHHIISPKTKRPMQYYHSITMIGEDAGYLDAVATALYSMPEIELIAWLSTYQNSENIELVRFNQDETITPHMIDTVFEEN